MTDVMLSVVLRCTVVLVERQYWSLVLLPLILVCLTIFGVLLVNKLKGKSLQSTASLFNCYFRGMD